MTEQEMFFYGQIFMAMSVAIVIGLMVFVGNDD